MRHFNKFSVKGQTMIEVLLALAIGVIIIAGISKAVNTSLSNSQFSKNQSSANQYAQEGMEIVRNLRPTPGSYCLAKGTTVLTSEDIAVGCPQNVDAFAREVNIQGTGTGVKNVTVTVGWSDSKCFGVTPMPTRIPSTCRPGAPCIQFDEVTPPTPTPTPASCESAASFSNLSSVYCHRVQLVSCLFDPEAVSAP
ncbi:MAG: prepilin-type N-terminal cleavage/methylation domain-containing protein [bacterium]|nr:prepilin-type N-terminal cleavage/methylation domain-containing protein [bacterium]